MECEVEFTATFPMDLDRRTVPVAVRDPISTILVKAMEASLVYTKEGSQPC